MGTEEPRATTALQEPPAMQEPDIPINKRVYSDGEGKQPLLHTLVAVVTLLIYCGWVNILLALIIGCFFFSWCPYVLLPIMSTALLPLKPLLWPAFNRLWIFTTWRRYFQFSFLFEEKLDLKKRYVLYELPHGTFPIGPVTAATMVQSLFAGAPIYSLAASSVFSIPFWRHFITWIGSVPASKANFIKLLQKGSVGVVVGGIAEMFMCEPDRERILLKGRKGFCRCAIEGRADGLVPVYYFGQSQVFAFGPKWMAGPSRKWRVSIGILHGRWGLPIPWPIPIFLVHGKPIPVPTIAKDDPGFEAAVDALHEKACSAVQELYERHRDEYGWADRPLHIE